MRKYNSQCVLEFKTFHTLKLTCHKMSQQNCQSPRIKPQRCPLNYIYCNARIPPQTNPQASKRRCPHQPCRRIVHTLVRNYLGFNLWAVSCFLDKPWMQSIGYVPLLGIIYRSLFLWSAIYCGSHIAEYPPGFFRPPPVSWFRQDSHPERLDPAGHF